MAFADSPTLHPANWLRNLKSQVPRKAARDFWNRFRYGRGAPLSDECIYVDPRRISHACVGHSPRKRRRHSGIVMGGDWDLKRRPLGMDGKLGSCILHYVDGVPWEDTPLFADMLEQIARGECPDECATREDVVKRYAALDRIFEETRERGRLLAKSELPDYFRREHGGVFVHVARDGTILRAGGGAHRLAIAKILELPEMPAQIGLIHPQAVASGVLTTLRHSRFEP